MEQMTREVFLATLDLLRSHVAEGDSSGGTLSFRATGNPETPFEVYAAYRIGTSNGQGTTRRIGDITTSSEPVDVIPARWGGEDAWVSDSDEIGVPLTLPDGKPAYLTLTAAQADDLATHLTDCVDLATPTKECS